MVENNGINSGKEWFKDYDDEFDDIQVAEYDITATPNDFNVITIFNYIEAGAVKIPGFQRNYVWDKSRASKLIESIILGLPVPQIFLYESKRTEYLVIDGQQRLMSIYYFVKKRFPRKEKRAELRSIFAEKRAIPDAVLHDDKYFTDFNLTLAEKLPDQPNKFKGLNYSTLGDYRTQFDLRPIRNVIVKQNSPSNDDSSIYEIFNRLNTGGTNLKPQEIRMSLYHSDFFDMLQKINMQPTWRKLLQSLDLDVHMKDIEILLRGFAMLMEGKSYAPSLTKFLNQFSRRCGSLTEADNEYLENLFHSFLEACRDLPDDIFVRRNKRFNIALFEAVFTSACEKKLSEKKLIERNLERKKIELLEADKEFTSALLEGTTGTVNVQTRLRRAREIIGAQ